MTCCYTGITERAEVTEVARRPNRIAANFWLLCCSCSSKKESPRFALTVATDALDGLSFLSGPMQFTTLSAA